MSRQGHKVTLLLPEPTNEQKTYANKQDIGLKSLGRLYWQGIAIQGYFRLIRRALRRLFKLFFEYPDIQLAPMVHKALRQESGYDLLISIAVPHPIHWGVACAWRQKNPIATTWIADCGDPYYGQENDTFRPPIYFKWLENWALGKATFITVPTAGAIAAYSPQLKPKIRVIPQGFRFEDIKLKANTGQNDLPRFAYAGIFIPGRRDPTEFLQYLVSLTFPFEFHIYTPTPEPVSAFQDDRIRLHDPLPREELLFRLSGLDFMVNFENAGQKQTPSKLIDYAIIDKPILSIKTGALNKTLVEEFLQGNYSGGVKIDKENYRIEKIASQFLALINQNRTTL